MSWPASPDHADHRVGPGARDVRPARRRRNTAVARIGVFAAACAAAWGGWQYFGASDEAAQTSSAQRLPDTASVSPVGSAPQQPQPQAAAGSAQQGEPAPGAEVASSALESNAVVLAVIDGDTMEVDLGGRRATVRFLGIDTPEKTGGYLPAECGGDAATRRTAELLPPGTDVLLQRDIELYDRYDRVLAYVYRAADGLFVNRYLVLDGYAGTMHFEPNTEHRTVLDAAEAEARAARRGIWADCGGPNRQLEGAS